MKSAYKIIVIGFSVFFVFGVFAKAMGAFYDTQAVMVYHDLWWNARNTGTYDDYDNINGASGDCCNYLSQLLIKGGADLTSGNSSSWYRGRGNTLPKCVDLREWMKIHSVWREEVEAGGLPNPFVPSELGLVKGDYVLAGQMCTGKNSSGVMQFESNKYRHGFVLSGQDPMGTSGRADYWWVGSHSSNRYKKYFVSEWGNSTAGQFNMASFYHITKTGGTTGTGGTGPVPDGGKANTNCSFNPEENPRVF